MASCLSAAVVVTSWVPYSNMEVSAATTSSNVYITEAGGWYESAYVEWDTVTNASSYRVYVKKDGAADSTYVQLDDQLIRKYDSYVRADALGLEAGNYDLRVEATLYNGTVVAGTTKKIQVAAKDRSGFAFSKDSTYKTGSGAYTDKGTLRNDAQVVYVTPETAKTCTATVNGKKVTGFQAILDAKKSAGTKDTGAIDFRLIGCIEADDVDYFGSSAEGIQIKGKTANSEMNITIEGVGEDAAVNGFGFLIRNAGNVEITNLGVMNFMDDGISLDTKNTNIWVHNTDLFYGSAGSDADQVKGDGSIDVKAKSTYVTVSYNHFFDSGKCSLCGMSDTEEFMVTYHHNWFDHSDSRHPRIRVGSIHIYNNYFDGNAKYGVGVTKGASAFVESNYFNNNKSPMMSSLQGTDAKGDGTFSGEAGGMIKAYNNKVVGASSLIYANSNAGTQSANAKSFDAYLAAKRAETVPSTYKTVSGGTVYNNFDTKYDLGVEESAITAVENVPTVVKATAGRMNGGDFKWTFSDSDNTKYTIDKELKQKVVDYKSSLKSIGGNGSKQSVTKGSSEATQKTDVITIADKINGTTSGSGSTGSTESGSTGSESTGSTESGSTVSGSTDETAAIVHNFTKSGKTSSFFNILGNLSSKNSITYNGVKLTKCLKMESKTSVTFTTDKETTLTLVFAEKNQSGVAKISGTSVKSDANGVVKVKLKAGTHKITKNKVANLYYMQIQ